MRRLPAPELSKDYTLDRCKELLQDNPQSVERLFLSIQEEARKPEPAPSDEELLDCLARGWTRKETCEEFGIAAQTLRARERDLCQATGAKTIEQAVARYARRALTPRAAVDVLQLAVREATPQTPPVTIPPVAEAMLSHREQVLADALARAVSRGQHLLLSGAPLPKPPRRRRAA